MDAFQWWTLPRSCNTEASLKQRVRYVGLDVDDTYDHGAALSQATGAILSFQCRPTLQGLVNQRAKLRTHFASHPVHVAYEASSIGSTLQRDLARQGYHGDVVAPSRLPRVGGKAITTERLDAAQLAQLYAHGLLSLVHVPSQAREPDRDLMRSRQPLWQQRTDRRQHVQIPPGGTIIALAFPSTAIAIGVRPLGRPSSAVTARPGWARMSRADEPAPLPHVSPWRTEVGVE